MLWFALLEVDSEIRGREKKREEFLGAFSTLAGGGHVRAKLGKAFSLFLVLKQKKGKLNGWCLLGGGERFLKMLKRTL